MDPRFGFARAVEVNPEGLGPWVTHMTDCPLKKGQNRGGVRK